MSEKLPEVDSQLQDFVEALRPEPTHDTRRTIEALPAEYREYLLARHGTLDLDPIPDMSDADPYNWPHWKKVVNLLLVAFHAFMATFTASALSSIFIDIAKDLGCSVQRASYMTSIQILVSGVAPLFWAPLSDRYGRRPIFLISLICSLAGNIGCARSYSYASMALCRAIVAFFISPAAAIGTAVVAETFFKRTRARYMGIWTIMVIMGIPLSPFIFSFVAYRVDYRWIYWILAMVNGVEIVLYVFFGPETRYLRGEGERQEPASKKAYLTFRRIDPKPLRLWDFVQPLSFVARPRVMVPTCAYSMCFLFAAIMAAVEIPQLFGLRFHLNTQQIGLQFISMIIGTVIGEQLGGYSSDVWMIRRQRKLGTQPAPEWRLWLSYPGYLLSIVGTIVFLVQIERAGTSWNVTPLVGFGLASAGIQIITTVLITYAVDWYREEAASVGVFVTFVRQTWGFIGPFWFPQMFDNLGLYGSAGLATGLMVVFGVLPTIALQWKGGKGW